MISVQSAMLVALGFLAASLLGLLIGSALWSRAVRLTTLRLKQTPTGTVLVDPQGRTQGRLIDENDLDRA